MWWDRGLRDPLGYSAVDNMVANKMGNYETARQGVAWSASNTVTGTVINADAIQKTDGTGRLFACTATKIYEVAVGSVTDRSAGGSTYTTGTHWSCAQYGDVTIYTNRADDVQASSSGAFADLAGTPPKARYVCTQSLAVALAAYNDGVNTYEDGLWFSDIGDHTVWTPSSSNQAANLRLLQTPGAITALCSFKGDVLAWKENSFYRVSYVGLPVIWNPVLISDNIGASGPGVVLVCGDVVLFGGIQGWYIYDGQGVTPLAPGADPVLGGPSPLTYAPGAAHFEPSYGLAHFAIPGTSTAVLTFQMERGDGFGAAGEYFVRPGDVNIRCLVRGSAPALIAAGIGTMTVQNTASFFMVNLTNSAPFALSAVWGSQLTADAYVLTNLFGDVRRKTLFRRVTPLLGTRGTGTFLVATLAGSIYERSDRADTAPQTVTASLPATSVNPRFDVLKSGRFAEFQITTSTKPMEIEDILVDMQPAGVD